MNWDTIIIGAGFAGLSAGARLAEVGKRVLVLERRPLLGGRASSFKDEASGEVLDNGQHLFLGAYTDTLEYLRRIGSFHLLKLEDGFATPMIGPKGELALLQTSSWLPAPLHMARGLMTYRALSLSERLATLRVARAATANGTGASGKTVRQWLTSLGQSERSLSRLWEPMTLATINVSCDVAPAELLSVVLRDGFLKSKAASRMGLSTVGLSDLHGEPAAAFIASRGGEVRRRSSVKRLIEENDRIIGVQLADDSIENANAFISAVPPPSLRQMADGISPLARSLSETESLASSSILSLHAWFERPPFESPIVGFWDHPYHWAFSKRHIYKNQPGTHVSFVISAAGDVMSRSKDELVELLSTQLRDVGVASVKPKRVVLMKEMDATWVPRVTSNTGRLGAKTEITNFFIAGDWTDTGLPATIESAVRSGHAAAALVQHA